MLLTTYPGLRKAGELAHAGRSAQHVLKLAEYCSLFWLHQFVNVRNRLGSEFRPSPVAPLDESGHLHQQSADALIRTNDVVAVLTVEKTGHIVKADLPAESAGHQVCSPVMPDAVVRVNPSLRQQHGLAQDHGVSTGNVFQQRIAKARWAPDSRAQSLMPQLFVHNLGSAAIQAHRALGVLCMPFRGTRQLVFQPYIVLIAECIEVGRTVCWRLLDEVKEVLGGRPATGTLQQVHTLRYLSGKAFNDSQRIVGRTVVADRQRPARMGLPRDGGQLVRQVSSSISGGKQDMDSVLEHGTILNGQDTDLLTLRELSVGVVVPTRNPGRFWPIWLRAMGEQRPAVAGVVVDSSSDDGTDFSSVPAGWQVQHISAADFNHGRTRNLALKHLPHGTDVVVFLTQDAVPADCEALQKLVCSFEDPSVAAAYGRQLPAAGATPIATHARLFNYPAGSRTTVLADRAQVGIKACFLSNSFAAYRMTDLLEAGGFPDDVILGEDTIVAARLLLMGKAIRYEAEACVHHSHNYTVLEELRRYFDTGVLHARQARLLGQFGGAHGEGLRFVRSELAFLWRRAAWKIPSALVRTFMKLLGYRLGRAERLLPLPFKQRLSMFSSFWHQERGRAKSIDSDR